MSKEIFVFANCSIGTLFLYNFSVSQLCKVCHSFRRHPWWQRWNKLRTWEELEHSLTKVYHWRRKSFAIIFGILAHEKPGKCTLRHSTNLTCRVSIWHHRVPESTYECLFAPKQNGPSITRITLRQIDTRPPHSPNHPEKLFSSLRNSWNSCAIRLCSTLRTAPFLISRVRIFQTQLVFSRMSKPSTPFFSSFG